jgi:hypothetical protein
MGTGYIYNYELGSVITVIALGMVALLRQARIVEVVIFGVSATAGMSLAIVSLQPENIFLNTFIGWSLVFVTAMLIVSVIPDIGGLFLRFWRIGPDSARINVAKGVEIEKHSGIPTSQSTVLGKPSTDSNSD